MLSSQVALTNESAGGLVCSKNNRQLFHWLSWPLVNTTNRNKEAQADNASLSFPKIPPFLPTADQEILRRLEKDKILVFTPSRRVQGRRVVCYDDRFIVKLAYESDGIIVSNDNYRDLANEKPEWKKFIDDRLLMYSFVNDK